MLLLWRERAALNKGSKGIITAVILMFLPPVYFINILAVGSLAASIHDIYHTIKPTGIFAATSERHGLMLPYITAHPIATGVAWITKSSRNLTHPDVRVLWLGLNIAVIPLVCKRWKNRRAKNNSRLVHGLKIADNPLHGTSRWGAAKDIRHLCEISPPDSGGEFPGGIFLGSLEGKMVRVIPGKAPTGMPPLAGHAAVFGGTGSGKSYSFVMNNIICAVADGQSFVVTDPKAELAETTANWLISRGYEVKVFNLNNPAHSHLWNPLRECGSDSEITEMAACFINNATNKDDNGYFVSKEIQLFEALSGLLLGDFPAEQQHLRSVISLASWNSEELDSRFRAAFESDRISAAIYEKWRGCSAVNLDNAISGLTAKLKILSVEAVAGLLSKKETDLSEVGKKKTALFCVLPVRGEGRVLRPILATFYLFLFKRLYDLADNNNHKLPVPVRFLLDEFANIGQIPGFSEIVSTARSLGIHIQFILQGRSQLDEVYGREEAKTILANCPTLFLLGTAPGDLETAEMFSKILGKAAVQGKFESEDVTLPIINNFQPTQKTKRVIERYLMTSDEIARMDPLDCIGVIQWCYPLYLQKTGWRLLTQAAEIDRQGLVSLKDFIPARRLDVSLPRFHKKQSESGEGPVTNMQAPW